MQSDIKRKKATIKRWTVFLAIAVILTLFAMVVPISAEKKESQKQECKEICKQKETTSTTTETMSSPIKGSKFFQIYKRTHHHVHHYQECMKQCTCPNNEISESRGDGYQKDNGDEDTYGPWIPSGFGNNGYDDQKNDKGNDKSNDKGNDQK
jgi:hypothetical protein